MAKIRKKILVVDDNPVTQKWYRRIFENAAYEVMEAFSGEECLSVIATNVPDVILMDVILPDVDGKIVVHKLSEQAATRNIPLVFVTNTLAAEKDRGYEAIKINGVTYRAFAKPVPVGKLLSVIRKEYNRSRHGGQPSPKLGTPKDKARGKKR